MLFHCTAIDTSVNSDLKDELAAIPQHNDGNVYPDIMAEQIGQPDLVDLIQHFLSDQCCSDSDTTSSSDTPEFYETICVSTSAIATFYVPSDISGIGGMQYERIHTVDTW